MSKIFMIIVDKCPNHNEGIIKWGRVFEVGGEYPIHQKDPKKLNSIVEGLGANGKPVVVLVFEGNVTIEIPDYGIEKYRLYEE